MRRRHVSFVPRRIDILFIEEEDAGISRRPLRLVIQAARLPPRERGHLPDDLQNVLLLFLFCRPDGRNNVCHSYAPFLPMRLPNSSIPSISISTMSPSFKINSPKCSTC